MHLTLRLPGVLRHVVGLTTALLLTHCGAKTGLLIPDIGPEVGDVPTDEVYICRPTVFVLDRRRVEIALVIDRSSSMQFDLNGNDSNITGLPTRWNILADALRITLPPFEMNTYMGAVFFPRELPQGNGNIRLACSTATNVDVPLGLNQANRVLNVFATTQPNGGTPTFSAVRLASEELRGRGTRGASQAIILATDGGPNCNDALDYRTCRCTRLTQTGESVCAMDPNQWPNCLDDVRTVDEIDRIFRSDHIPTYVIGIDDVTRPDLTAVLNAMAVAGGRPNMIVGTERYYSARRPSDLTTAFDTIQRSIVRCAFLTQSLPSDPEGIDVRMPDGTAIPRDRAHTQGWDWTDQTLGEITIYGGFCEQLSNNNQAPTVSEGCTDGG